MSTTGTSLMYQNNKTITRSCNIPHWGRFAIAVLDNCLAGLELLPVNNAPSLFSGKHSCEEIKSITPSDKVHKNYAGQFAEYLEGRCFSLTANINHTADEEQASLFQIIRNIPYGLQITVQQVLSQWPVPNAKSRLRKTLQENPVPVFIPCHRIISDSEPEIAYVWGNKFRQRLLRLEAINKSKLLQLLC